MDKRHKETIHMRNNMYTSMFDHTRNDSVRNF